MSSKDEFNKSQFQKNKINVSETNPNEWST